MANTHTILATVDSFSVAYPRKLRDKFQPGVLVVAAGEHVNVMVVDARETALQRMDRPTVAELHAWLGEWLEDQP